MQYNIMYFYYIYSIRIVYKTKFMLDNKDFHFFYKMYESVKKHAMICLKLNIKKSFDLALYSLNLIFS